MGVTGPGRVQVHVLGGFEVTVDGRRLGHADWQRLSAERLVKLLVVTAGHSLSREAAAETLWPETSPDAGRASLRKAVHFARHAFGAPDALSAEADNVRLDPLAVQVDLDLLLDAFATLGRHSRVPGEPPVASGLPGKDLYPALATVLELGSRTLLPDDGYEDWLVAPREQLRSRWQLVALDAANQAIAAGRTVEAHRLIEQLLDRDPSDEVAHRLAIGLYASEGRHHAARRQFELCRRALLDGLDAQPSEETVEAFRRAERCAEDAPAAVAPVARLIGRQRELEHVEPLLDRVAMGRLGTLMVRGAPGIGKTRLLEEVREYARGAGWSELAWQAVESTREVPFAVFAVRLPAIVTARDVSGWGEPERSGVATLIPGLGIVPRIPFADRSALVMALLAALSRIAGRRPLLIAIDDVAWLDDASVDLLEAAVISLPDAPILVGVTYRDDEPVLGRRADLLERLRRTDALELRLGSLAERDIEPLILGHLGGESVEPSLCRLLHVQSEGNPLFCLEIARAARATGALRVDHERWALAAGTALTDPPETVRHVVAARTRTLPRPVAELLRIAALLGPEIDCGTLEVVLPDLEGGVIPALDTALATGLLVEHGGGYTFAHPLFRSAVESAAGPAWRAQTHLAIARALARNGESRDGAEPDALMRALADPTPVAEHALRAVELGNREAGPMAVAFGFAAAARARVLFDSDGARDLYERAIAVWERLPRTEASRHDASGAFVGLAELRLSAGDEPGAEAAFRAAIEAARMDGELAFAYERFCWLPYRHGDFAGAISLADEALARLPPDARAPRALVGSMTGWCLGRLHRIDESITCLGGCVDALDDDRDRALLARVLDRLGMMLPFAGRHAEALATLQRSLAIALDLGDARGELVRIHLGAALTRSGRAAEARPHAARALQLTEQMGDWYLDAVAAWMAAEMEDALGDDAAARAMRERELSRLARIGGNPHNEALSHAHLSHLARRGGEQEVTAREAEIARALAARDPDPGYAGRIEAALAVERWSELQSG